MDYERIIKRRTFALDNAVKKALLNRDKVSFNSVDSAFDYVSSKVAEKIYYTFFYDLTDTGDEWAKIYEQIIRYVYNVHYDKISKLYSPNKTEFKESEITERCWKGYTQKGMKTMFGKRYPNCVKKK